jgi:hypothetical protein
LIFRADGRAWTLDVQEYVVEQNISACGDELTRNLGKFHTVEFCDSSQYIIQVIKSRMVR